jgi:long-chain acyl-CoA synthetase
MELSPEHEDSFAALEARGQGRQVAPLRVDGATTCGFIYTSGTTGNPKGVLLSHGNIASNVNAVESLFPIREADCSLSFLPWAHSFGQTCELHCLLSRGATVAIAESIDKLGENLLEVRPTILFCVPRLFNRIYDGVQERMREAPGLRSRLFHAALRNARRRRELKQSRSRRRHRDLLHALYDRLVFARIRARFGGRLAFTFSGGAALSLRVLQFFSDLGIAIYEGYGLTETGPIVSANCPGACRPGSVGRPLPGVEVRIEAGNGDDAPHEGEILVKGPNVMQGYHNLPAENERVFTLQGEFRTGDLGRLDADGYLFITGRIKEQYKLENGRYVVPSLLEELFQASPFINQVLVVGDNRPYNVALIVPDRDALSREAIRRGAEVGAPEELYGAAWVGDLLRDELARFEVRRYERVERFALVAEEFSVDNGLLTPKMSLRRRAIVERYHDIIVRLYSEAGPD